MSSTLSFVIEVLGQAYPIHYRFDGKASSNTYYKRQ